MSFVYTRASLKAVINRFVQNKGGMLVDSSETSNDAVRMVLGDADLRSARRKNSLVPNLFNAEYDYACPSDLKAYGIIDIPQQAKREDGEFNLVPSREFATNKKSGDIAIDDFNGQRILKINSKVADKTLVISELDALTSGGGTWSAIDDADNLRVDSNNYIMGNGALKFSVPASVHNSAGIANSGLDIDITDYLEGNGALFVWMYIGGSFTSISEVTISLGSDINNYYTVSVTTQNDGTAFAVGWNLLRFDLTSNYLNTNGSPDAENISIVGISIVVFSPAPFPDVSFDYLVLKVGKNADVKYYSKFGWQTATGSYIENSTLDTDVLVAETDEYELICKAGIYLAAQELDLSAGGRNPLLKIEDLGKQYEDELKEYQFKNPSEAMIMTNEYYKY